MPTARILVIDDDQDICLLLSRFLIKNGYSVETAGRGNLAKELLAKERYDLVLCDHRLPDTDALQLLQHIRGMNDHTQVIIITGYSEVRLAVELMRRGAFDFLPKPFATGQLVELLTRLLGLTWRAAPAAAIGADALTAELRASLRVAADAGDIMALRTALRAARERQPSASSFIDQLEKLAAGYQLERIRQLLNDPPGP